MNGGTAPVLLLLLLLLLAVLCPGARAKINSGDISYEQSEFRYLDKFCFDSSGGRVTVAVRGFQNAPASTNTASQTIAFFADVPDQWDHVYKGSGSALGCSYRENRASLVLNTATMDPNWPIEISVTGVRPRWWYLALFNCPEGYTGLQSHEIIFTNNQGGFNEHFSYDEQGIFEMAFFFGAVNFVLLVVLGYSKALAKVRHLQYGVFKRLFVAVVMQMGALGCDIIHYTVYADDGVGTPGLKDFGFVLYISAHCVFVLTLMMLSRGWTISTNYIPRKRQLYGIVLVLWLCSMALLIWEKEARDPASTLYVYESPPGFAIIAAQAVTMAWFLLNLRQTIKHESNHNKLAFYRFFGCFAVNYFLSLPVTVLIAAYIDSWYRQKLVYGFVQTMSMFFYWCLWWIFRPLPGGKTFDVLKPDESRAFGTNTMQIFPMAGNFDDIENASVSEFSDD